MDPITIAMALAQFAPQIVRWVSGSERAGEAAQKVVAIAQAATGTQSGQAALEAMRADPAALLAFRQTLAANEAALDKAYLLDRADARARDVAYVAHGRYNWRGDVLAMLAVGGLVACVYFIASDSALPERAVNAIMFVAGVLASAVRDVYGFEFGSSRSSKDKDATIQGLVERQ